LSTGPTEVDYLIVGSGSAGAAVAYRLSATGCSVLVAEAGSAYTRPEISALAAWPLLLGSDVDWAYRTTPQESTANRTHVWSRGKVLGGTSSINGMVWMRGAPWDFDGWEKAGCTGWGYADVTTAYMEFEDFPGGDPKFREQGGPMRIRTMTGLNPLTEAFLAACAQRGFAPAADFNGAAAEGFGPHQINAVDGARWSSYSAFIKPIRDRPNVTVHTSAMVHRLELDPAGSTVVAAHIVRDGVAQRWRINREVIVSAGTIESPKLLMLSGIGPAEHLAELGIEVRIDLPGVGQNLHDHLAASVSHRATKHVPPPRNTGLEGALFCRSTPQLEHYDLQYSFIHIPTLPPDGLAGGNGFTFFGGALPSASRGSLTLTSTDPWAHPRIDPRYLTEKADVERLVAAVEIGRELASAPAFDEWRGAEIAPTEGLRSKDELRDYVARTAQTFFHPVGTCKMGAESDSVVDPWLRVHGTRNLRIADASVIPDIPSANPNATATMIGWRAGGFIRSGNDDHATHEELTQ
jgi:choline dehydrogenase